MGIRRMVTYINPTKNISENLMSMLRAEISIVQVAHIAVRKLDPASPP